MEKNDKIRFALVEIRTEQFTTFNEKVEEGNEIELQTSLGFKVNEENKQVGVYIKIEFIQNEKSLIIIETSNHFIIHPEAWEQFCSVKNTKLIIPENFAIHLVGLSLGTTRGVLHAKTENTSFNKYFIPTIAVKNLMNKDVELSLEEEDS